MATRNGKVISFDFKAGRVLARKYRVVSRLGSGWEGEVYLARERETGIEHAIKVFFPHRNPKNKVARRSAQRMHKLRNCDALIKYHTQEKIQFQRNAVTCLVSDFVDGELLTQFVDRQVGKRLPYFQGLHLLYALAKGVERIHRLGEYHGDLHADNIFVVQRGLGFEVKLIDMYNWGDSRVANIKQDVIDLVRLLYDVTGGVKRYATQPSAIKDVCCGLKHSLILKKYKNAGALRVYLEDLQWNQK